MTDALYNSLRLKASSSYEPHEVALEEGRILQEQNGWQQQPRDDALEEGRIYQEQNGLQQQRGCPSSWPNIRVSKWGKVSVNKVLALKEQEKKLNVSRAVPETMQQQQVEKEDEEYESKRCSDEVCQIAFMKSSSSRMKERQTFRRKNVDNKTHPQITCGQNRKGKAYVLRPQDLRVCRCVGRGSFGRVILMSNVENKQAYALKEVSKTKLSKTKAGTEKALMEKRILEKVGVHPYIVSYHATWQDDCKIYMLMDFVNGFELYTMMQRFGALPITQVRLYAAEIAVALNFLHSNCIIYQDLKPENVLIDHRGHVKLVDFGLSRLVDCSDQRVKTACGTPEYLAPEVLLSSNVEKNAEKNEKLPSKSTHTYGIGVDFWALGVIVYEMLYRAPPFYDTSKQRMYEKILKAPLRFPRDYNCEDFENSRNTSTDIYHLETLARDFISQLIVRDERRRLGVGTNGARQVVTHPFFAALDLNKLHCGELEPEYVPDVKDAFDCSNFDEEFTKESIIFPEKAPRLLAVDGKSLTIPEYKWLQPGFPEYYWYSGQRCYENKENHNYTGLVHNSSRLESLHRTALASAAS